MTGLDSVRRALVIAPHPDDEVLGCGGTLARLAAMGCETHVAVVTSGRPPRYSAESVAETRAEAEAAHRLLGVAHSHWLGLPAAELDRLPQAEINAALATLIDTVAPDLLLLPFVGDIHRDHQLVFGAGLVAARPRSTAAPARILAYETLSETNWHAPPLTPGFLPNVFIDISATLATKLAAFAAFRTQVQAPPAERSLAALEALATLRGATVFRAAAEAFVLIREIG